MEDIDIITMTLFTVQEVAAMLKLSVLTIYKYIKDQQLEAVEFGGHYRISQSSLEAFIQGHTIRKVSNVPKVSEVSNVSKESKESIETKGLKGTVQEGVVNNL